MSWKTVYRILDDADLFTDMQIYKEDNGDFTAESAEKYIRFLEDYSNIILRLDHRSNDYSVVDWQYVADKLNAEEH